MKFQDLKFPRPIFAAGGVLIHENKLVIVHRPKYDDWSLPKGKLQADENFISAAIREVQEETYCQPEVHNFAGAIHYPLKGAHKFVLFWIMSPYKVHTFIPNNEIDQVEWIDFTHAKRWLAFQQELDLLECTFSIRTEANQSTQIPEYDLITEKNHMEEAVYILRYELEQAKKQKNPLREKNLETNLRFLLSF